MVFGILLFQLVLPCPTITQASLDTLDQVKGILYIVSQIFLENEPRKDWKIAIPAKSSENWWQGTSSFFLWYLLF